MTTQSALRFLSELKHTPRSSMSATSLLLAGFLLFQASLARAQTVGGDSSNEISAIGEAPFAAAPDSSTLTVTFEQTSTSAAEANATLSARINKSTEALRSQCPGLSVRLRGEQYLSASGSPNATLTLKSGTPITLKRTIALGCDDLTTTSKIVDALMSLGGGYISDISSFVNSNQKPNLDAIQLATGRAKQKAELIAQTLGVKLGPVISVVATEEPEGESLRAQMKVGENIAAFGDKVLHVYVTVRYGITR